MKNLFILFIFSSIISCSTTQSSKKMGDISYETTAEQNEISIASIREYGKTSRFGDPEILPYPIKKVLPEKLKFTPTYPLKGEVWLEVEIFEDGSVGAINVVKSLMAGPGGLDEAAVNSVKKWIFEPAMSAEKPVACWITLSVSFELK